MFLMVYHSAVYKEISLSGIDNADYEVSLDASEFQMRGNVLLKLEVSGGAWRLFATDSYTLYQNNQKQSCIALHNEAVLHLKTHQGETLHIVPVDGGDVLPVTQKINLSGVSALTFGSDRSNGIRYAFQDLVSKQHGRLVRQQDGWYLQDNSTNGTYRNGTKVQGSCRLTFGDRIDVFGLVMVYLGSVLCVASRTLHSPAVDPQQLGEVTATARKVVAPPPAPAPEKVWFNRAPRTVPEIYEGEVTIEPVPDARFAKRKPLLLTIGPSFTMALPMLLGCLLTIFGSQASGRAGGVFMYTGIVTALGSAALGTVWGILNLRQARREESQDEQKRMDLYGNYLIGVAQDLRQKYQQNVQALHDTYLPVETYCSYTADTAQLWDRNQSHRDFLFYRLGLGEMPFPVQLHIPKESFSLEKDRLKEKPRQIQQEFAVMQDVPVGIDLARQRLVGVVGGPDRTGCLPVVYTLLAGIAANNCYTDVKIVFVAASDEERSLRRWEALKWLPHVWNESRTTRYIAMNAQDRGDVFFSLLDILRRRSQEGQEAASEKKRLPKPYYVLFVEDPALLQGELLAKYVFDRDPALGLTTILMAETTQELPNECEEIIENDASFCGRYNTVEGGRQAIRFDQGNAAMMETLARHLSNVQVRENETDAEIPTQLDFLSMYGVQRLEQLGVAERWRKSRTFRSMRVPIGAKAGGELCYLDIHEKYHGPHGLLAGTTGSGKSETLQTYILSLALQYSPDDIGFFIIDFKGGGMANLFEKLPHMLGTISNLSGNQVRRAMISIKSENKRRQRLFNEYGVNNISHYTRLYKNGESKIPLPHLFIIIDEFAELKREQPDFMRELISVAQVGRSLGVHLVLATQKPSGTVDDNIWSNAKFRICLRVQDRQDSQDMLHRPDAAFITQAGRGFLQVGNDEIFEEFQSAWSGAIYDEHSAEGTCAAVTMLTRTGKTGIVGSRAKMRRYERQRREWLQRLAALTLQLCPEGPDDRDEAARDALAHRLLESDTMTRAGFGSNATDLAMVRRFLDGWPAHCTDAARAAEAILRKGGNLPYPHDKTQLEALVEYLAEVAAREGYRPSLKLWMPCLPEKLPLQSLPGWQEDHADKDRYPALPAAWDLRTQVGLLDDPENQSQRSWSVDFGNNGHHAVLGAVVTGKSTFLQTLVYSLVLRYPPDRLNLYLLDFSSHMLAAFENDAHVGAVLYENDLEQIGKLMRLLEKMMEERKRKLGGGNYTQFVRAYGVQFPAIVVVLDNYAAFAEKTANSHEQTLLRLAREGVGYGMYLVISAASYGINELPNRIGDNLRTTVCLDVGDKFKFVEAMHTTHLPVLPESGVAGRGLVPTENGILEFQTAVAVEADDDYARSRAIAETCRRMTEQWQGRTARKVPVIPEMPRFSLLREQEEYPEALQDPARIPLGYRQDDASLYSLDRRNLYCYSILGREHTGKTNVLKLLLQVLAEKGGRLVVFEKQAGLLEALAGKVGAEYITDDASLFAFWKKLTPVFVARNKKKQALLAQGLVEQEIYERMAAEEEPIYLFIADLAVYLQSVYTPQPGVGEMKGFMETIFAKGALHNIYIFGAYQPENMAALNNYAAYRSFAAAKRGMLLGGNVGGQRLFTFRNVPYAELNRTAKRGVAMVPDEEDDTTARYIVLPLAER